MTYIYLKTDGSVELLQTEKKLTLEQLQKLVGGLIDFAPAFYEGQDYCVNEEGLINGLPENPHAHYQYEKGYPCLRGNVVLGITNAEGEFVGFEPHNL